jgi:hypothetical protein
VNVQESFEVVKNCYLSLPKEIREKYRGRFTPIIDELEVCRALEEQGFEVGFKSGQGSYDLIVDKKKKVEVKACNRDNTWVKKREAVKGCSGIKPSKFDYLIYVEFDDSLSRFEHFIFTSKEAAVFPLTWKEKLWYADRYKNSESRTLNIPFSTAHINITEEEAESLNNLVKKAKEAWDKIVFRA